MRLELQVLNAFNQQTARHIFNNLNRGAGVARQSSAIDLGNIDLAKGYDYKALIRATPDGANAFDPRYGKADLFSPGYAGSVPGQVPVLDGIRRPTLKSASRSQGEPSGSPFFWV